jgi:hypothetical protein
VKLRESGSRNKLLLPSNSSRCNCCPLFSRICWLKLEGVPSTSKRSPSIPGFLSRFCARSCVLDESFPYFARKNVGCHVKVLTRYFLTL